MVVSKNYKIKEQNGMYYIVPSSVPGCPQCGGEMKIRDSKRRQVKYPKRGNEKAAGELPVKGKMKKQQADACNLCDQ